MVGDLPNHAAFIAAAADVSLKASIIGALAAIGTGGLRGASANVRYRLWLGALIAVVVTLCLAPVHADGPSIGEGVAPIVINQSMLPRALSSTLAWCWLVGAAALALRCAIGFAALLVDEHRLIPLETSDWKHALADARRATGARLPVRVLAGTTNTGPMCWGTFAATIVVPSAAAEWGAELRRSVLVHELAHLRRRDPVVILVEQLVGTLLWFHPAVWLLLRRLRHERELACDEMVVASGVSPGTYAEQLVTLARTGRAAYAAAHPIVAMSGLERRVAALCDADELPARPSRETRRITLVATFATLLSLVASVIPAAVIAPPVAVTAAPSSRSPEPPGESPASFRASLFGRER